MKDLVKTYKPFIGDVMREVFGHLETVTPELLEKHGHEDLESSTEAQVNAFASIAMTAFCKYMKFVDDENKGVQLELFMEAVIKNIEDES